MTFFFEVSTPFQKPYVFIGKYVWVVVAGWFAVGLIKYRSGDALYKLFCKEL